MRHAKLLFLGLSPLLLSGCVSLSLNLDKEKDEGRTEQVINYSYEDVKEYKIYWNDIFKQPYDLYYVYLYSSTCSHCNSIKNDMIEYALGENETLFFVSSSAEHVINENIDKFEHIDSLENLAIKGYPTLLKLEQKVVVKNLAGTKDITTELNI